MLPAQAAAAAAGNPADEQLPDIDTREYMGALVNHLARSNATVVQRITPGYMEFQMQHETMHLYSVHDWISGKQGARWCFSSGTASSYYVQKWSDNKGTINMVLLEAMVKVYDSMTVRRAHHLLMDQTHGFIFASYAPTMGRWLEAMYKKQQLTVGKQVPKSLKRSRVDESNSEILMDRTRSMVEYTNLAIVRARLQHLLADGCATGPYFVAHELFLICPACLNVIKLQQLSDAMSGLNKHMLEEHSAVFERYMKWTAKLYRTK